MFYEDLSTVDVLGPIEGECQTGKMALELGEDGNLCVKLKFLADVNYPWVHSVISSDRKCIRWLGIYWKYYHLIPRGCQGCWKTVVKPRNLGELMKVHKIQKELGITSKVGMEQRPYGTGHWGAYWYAPITGGLQGGRKVFGQVKEAMKPLGLKPILKRACTEMEYGAGSSDKWIYGPEHRILEDLLDKFFIGEPMELSKNPANLQVHVMKRWVEWAYRNDDQTVWQFAERASFPKKYVRYDDSLHTPRDFPVIFEPEVKLEELPDE